jgi:hypothetical protein
MPVQEQVVVAADDDELVSRLRALLPREVQAAANNGKAKASSSSRARVLREACVYIRRLHAELDAAAEHLARLLDDDYPSAAAAAAVVDDGANVNAGAADDELIRNLLLM